MNYEEERQRLMRMLQIPITRVEVKNFQCHLFFRNEAIGNLPVVISSSGIQYQMPAFPDCVDWPKIFEMNYFCLKTAVARQLRVRKFRIVPFARRRLFIEDKDGNLFASFRCGFENGKWSVVDERILFS